MKRMIKDKNEVVTYYWYDAGIIRNTPDQKIIENAFKNHDFETFMKMRTKYPATNEFTFFPDVATVYDLKKDEYLGELDITTPENFKKIDEVHFEWG